MPPRIQLFQGFKVSQGQSTRSIVRCFTSSPCSNASTVTQRRKYRDPYAVAQATARKAANISRQEVLRKERAAALGDPVRGITTPFVQSFDNPPLEDAQGNSTNSGGLNFYLQPDEVSEGIERSQDLAAQPDSIYSPSTNDFLSAASEESRREQVDRRLEVERETAEEALRRISQLSLGSAKDRLRVNKARCIEHFGRHNTDNALPSKARSHGQSQPEKTERAGPDTGSSEVQIAILTAKIRSLSEFLTTRGRTDKVNKRNLRLLVHRRQKLLQYLRRKDRGGPRWQHITNTLGLTEGTWKGEISL
ncbi:putative ribosomal protein S15 [Polychaeton citri CBS 116435]|uniref:Ribosomal protein S15 n=1 Tax=Polychaeton citri CBS 116435 TaxID=1314669 RepID=A0A9P4Q1W2_9PEZI|nr:putative ribosomal protein S15 [Polychaeton citri CBS 116435]